MGLRRYAKKENGVNSDDPLTALEPGVQLLIQGLVGSPPQLEIIRAKVTDRTIAVARVIEVMALSPYSSRSFSTAEIQNDHQWKRYALPFGIYPSPRCKAFMQGAHCVRFLLLQRLHLNRRHEVDV